MSGNGALTAPRHCAPMIEGNPVRQPIDTTDPGARDGGRGDPQSRQSARYALIIDDQEEISRLIAAALARVGVESASYPTANPALSSLDQRRPDVIFLDVALEQSDAIDVIKGLSERRYTGIVQLMSGGRLPLIEAVQRIGARHGLVLRPALQKPFRGDDLQRAIIGAGLAPP
jgi:DNA-binding NtrC family response regulator